MNQTNLSALEIPKRPWARLVNEMDAQISHQFKQKSFLKD